MLKALCGTGTVVLCVGVVGALSAGRAAASVTIDDFTQGPVDYTVTTSTDYGDAQIQTGLDADHTLGGKRTITAYPNGDPDNSGTARYTVDTSAGTFTYDTTNAQFGTEIVDLHYGATKTGPNGNDVPEDRMNADLTQGGANDRFRITVLSVDAADDVQMNMHVATHVPDASSGNDGLYFFNLHPSATPYTVELLFSDINTYGHVVDFTDVDGLQLSGTLFPEGSSIQLGSIVAAPEPGALALLAVGLPMVWSRRRGRAA